MKIKKTFLSIAIFFTLFSQVRAAGFFSGYAGAKTDFAFADDANNFNMQMKIQAFFAAQFNITNNIIARTEFSVNTSDLIENNIFDKTPADFQIDEISLIFRKEFKSLTNFFSIFVGTYEPIGSDMFLRRQFGIEPISSKITESWLGLAGSIMYPLFGMGVADVMRFSKEPIAFGTYIYFNKENAEKNFVFNTDLRLACAYQYFYLDFALGLNTPLKTKTIAGQDVILLIDSLYGHAGINMLVGNNYTPASFFAQAGIYDIPFKRGTDPIIFNPNNVYFLTEIRAKISSFNLALTAFSLTPKTIENLIFIKDTLGVNASFIANSVFIGKQKFEVGVHNTLSFSGKNYLDIKDFASLFATVPTISVAPYISTNIGRGELHFMMQASISDFIKQSFAKAIQFNIGYKTQI